jgi:predicted DNA-binding transcriptional regulator AlpA
VARQNTNSDPWMSTQEAADHLGYSTATLRTHRSKGTGPAYVKSPTGMIRYRRSALDKWLKSAERGRR